MDAIKRRENNEINMELGCIIVLVRQVKINERTNVQLTTGIKIGCCFVADVYVKRMYNIFDRKECSSIPWLEPKRQKEKAIVSKQIRITYKRIWTKENMDRVM